MVPAARRRGNGRGDYVPLRGCSRRRRASRTTGWTRQNRPANLRNAVSSVILPVTPAVRQKEKMMSDFAFNCPHCNQHIEAPEDMLGKQIECPDCNGTIQLPEPKSQPPPVLKKKVVVSKRPVAPSQASTSPSGNTERYGMPNYDKYAKYTQKRDWKSLCTLNGVELDSFGTKKELKVLPKYLEENEVVFALTSGIMEQTETSNAFDWGSNTWLVVLTSERFLFLDHAMLTSSVDTQSIRHDRVQAVSASQGWVLGKVTVDLGARTVVIDNCQKATVAAMADLANKWLAALQKRTQEAATAGGTGDSSPLDEIKKLAELHSMGALSDEEFAAAKTKLLASM